MLAPTNPLGAWGRRPARNFSKYRKRSVAGFQYKRTMSPDRRSPPRTRVDVPATIVRADGLSRMACRIVDQTSDGVRVALSQAEDISGDCYILFEHRMEPCRPMWQSKGSVGFEFFS